MLKIKQVNVLILIPNLIKYHGFTITHTNFMEDCSEENTILISYDVLLPEL